MRQSRLLKAERLFSDLADANVLYTRGATSVGAVRELWAGFDALAGTALDDTDARALDGYCADVFAPAVERRAGHLAEPDAFVPGTPPAHYLQRPTPAGALLAPVAAVLRRRLAGPVGGRPAGEGPGPGNTT